MEYRGVLYFLGLIRTTGSVVSFYKPFIPMFLESKIGEFLTPEAK